MSVLFWVTFVMSSFWSEIINLQKFFNKNCTWRYTYLVKCRITAYFVKDFLSQIPTQIPEAQITQMLDFLIDNMFVKCGGYKFQQTVGIPIWYKLCTIACDLILYSYEAEFIQNILKSGN